MKKLICLLLLLCLLPWAAIAEERYDALPPLQQMTQPVVHTILGGGVYMDIATPVTANAAVNAEMAALVGGMAETGRAALPAKPVHAQEGACLNVGSSVYRTGEKWMSFLTVAAVMNGREQPYVDFDARAYDIESGARLTLGDVLADDAGWQIVSDAVRAQLDAYYPAEAADEAALAALAAREGLESTGFTLTVAFLQLHYRADALYPGKQTLMHVRVPYAALRGHLTDAALAQTDNSRYRLVALTFDDGPARGRTQNLLTNLRAGGANATFFIVGDRISSNRDVLCFEQDAGFSVGSHNYHHQYGAQNRGAVISLRDRLNAELSAVTGAQASFMRAPGGEEGVFIDENVGMPLFHWTLVSNSTDGRVLNPSGEALRLNGKIADGDIVLFHDICRDTDKIALTLPQMLAARGFLCVTVEELFAVRGIELKPNTVYYGTRED